MADTDSELDAAERALGTLDRAGESADDARLRAEWEARLAPLAELVASVAPPAELLGRIMERIGGDDLGAARLLRRERRRAARWRGAALVLAAACVALAVIGFAIRQQPGPELVAVAVAESGNPALIVSLDEKRGVAAVRPVGIAAPGSRSLELWHVPQGGAPVSLGLIAADAPRQVALNARPGDLVAVSVEPPGGSPTGQPTGPIIYSGRFLAMR